jgi:hypothetical protein
MDANIRKAAIRAAAKTAIVVSLSGCALDHGRPDPGTDAAIVMASDAGTDAFVRPTECSQLLASLPIVEPDPVSDPDWHWGAQFANESDRLDPRVGQCCLEMNRRAEEGIEGAEIGTALAMSCCEVVVTDQHLATWSALGCTPWGPPVPPEMVVS